VSCPRHEGRRAATTSTATWNASSRTGSRDGPGNFAWRHSSQHFLNDLFHQHGEHQNLLDFELLAWAVGRSGVRQRRAESRGDLLTDKKRFSGFPQRNDDLQTLLVRAYKR
jgi:hypothetical protein